MARSLFRLETPCASLASSSQPCLEAKERAAPTHRPRSPPSPFGNLWWRNLKGGELHLTLVGSSIFGPRATIRHPLNDCPLARGLLLFPFSYFCPFLGLELFGRDYFTLPSYIFTLLVSLPFLVCRFKRRSIDGEGSLRLGLDSHLGDRPSCMRFEKLKQTGF